MLLDSSDLLFNCSCIQQPSQTTHHQACTLPSPPPLLLTLNCCRRCFWRCCVLHLLQMSGIGAFILVLILLILQFIAFIWVSSFHQQQCDRAQSDIVETDP